MSNPTFSPWPSFTDEEADAVSRVLLSNKVNYWTGDECRQFEREFAQFADAGYAVALANGTLALDVALKVLGVGADSDARDEVIVTPRTFLASASSIVNAGAAPVFADIDHNTQNITADTIRAVITPRTRAIICVHLAGMPCDMDPIMALAAEHNLFVIEDCAQAHGARYKGRSVGSIGHIGAWSFCQDKIMSTGGEGGMVTTSDRDLWSQMWSYKDHGKSWEAVYEREHAPGFRWLHESFGTNWRMTEMQGAIGRIQLTRMTEWTKARLGNAARILDVAAGLPGLRVPPTPEWAEHGHYKCYVFVETDQLAQGWDRDRIMDQVRTAGAPCYSGSCSEVYLEAAFEGTDWRPAARLPVAKELGETSLMFLVHPTLSEDEISRTCAALAEVMVCATRQPFESVVGR